MVVWMPTSFLKVENNSDVYSSFEAARLWKAI
jgi:hypothetical protein